MIFPNSVPLIYLCRVEFTSPFLTLLWQSRSISILIGTVLFSYKILEKLTILSLEWAWETYNKGTKPLIHNKEEKEGIN